MKKLCFLAPDQTTAKDIIGVIREFGVDDRHLHVIARDVELDDELPSPSMLETSDFVPAAERGLALGGAAGLLAGVAAITFPPSGLALGGGALLLTTAAGAGVGAWASALVGVSADNSRIRQFEDAIDDGQILILVEVTDEQEGPVKIVVGSHLPDAEVDTLEHLFKIAA